jgi:2-methylcitrate dehydratase PrpD
LLGLDAPDIARAIEAAVGTVVVSSQSAATSGATIRNVYTGLTNLGGLLGPCLTRAGIAGEPGAAEVTFGHLLGDRFDPQLAVEDLGRRWFITQNYFKLHACSRWNHAPIEAMAHIRDRIDPDRVEAIVVETYSPATRLSRQLPPNWFGAKHSIAFNVVARLLFGRNDAPIYTDEVVRDPRVQALCQRVELREDAALTALVPDVRAARLRVRMAGGEEIVGFEDHAPGGFDRPYPRERLERKFLELTGPVLGGAASQQGMRMCLEADVLADATALAAALAGSPAPGADPS